MRTRLKECGSKALENVIVWAAEISIRALTLMALAVFAIVYLTLLCLPGATLFGLLILIFWLTGA